MNGAIKVIAVIASFAVAAFFLLFRLGKGDPVTDEIELAFRAVGYMDFLATPFQTTPLEWFSPAPWWTRFSFHDHPPLIFAFGHFVSMIFGDSLLAFRVPFAILGLASLFLLYLIGKRIFGDRVAVLSLAIGSLNTHMTWIGRIGLQEELVIFFTLLCLYLLIKAEHNRLYFFFWGAAFGLALLSKYTSVIILPVSALYLWYFDRAGLKNKYFYLSVLLALLMFSPILLYNIGMYQAVGHFDLQISALLGQDVSAHWQTLPGKAFGSTVSRALDFYPNFFRNDLPLALLSVFISFFLLYKYLRRRLERGAKFLVWTIVVFHLLIVLIGPSQRFLSMLVPWWILGAGLALAAMWEKRRSVGIPGLLLLVVAQGFYNYRTNLAYKTDSHPTRLSSRLGIETGSFGYNELEEFLYRELDRKRPGAMLGLPSRMKFVEQIRNKDYRGLKSNPKENLIIIYDPRINQVAKLWLFDRRYYYDGWPFVSVDEYLQIKKVAPQYFADLGIRDYIYIASTDQTFIGTIFVPDSQAGKFEQQMFIEKQVLPETEIVNRQNQKVFRIYRFSL